MSKLVCPVLPVVEATIAGLWYAWAYCQGYAGNVYLARDSIVYGVLIFLGVCLLVLVVLAGVSLFRKRHRILHGCSLLLFLGIFFSLRFLPSPEVAWVQGVKHRLLHDFTSENLRQFAKDVTNARIVREGGGDSSGWSPYPSVNPSPLSDAQKLAITQLKKSYRFLSSPDDGPSVLTYPDEVTLQWGPADEDGIWCGCSITLNGKKRASVDSRLVVTPVSADILFYYALPD